MEKNDSGTIIEDQAPYGATPKLKIVPHQYRNLPKGTEATTVKAESDPQEGPGLIQGLIMAGRAKVRDIKREIHKNSIGDTVKDVATGETFVRSMVAIDNGLQLLCKGIDYDQFIAEIDDAIKQAPTPKEVIKLQFYREAAVEGRRFKREIDAISNRVMRRNRVQN